MLLKSSLAVLAASFAILAPSGAEAKTRIFLDFFVPQYYSPAPVYYYPGPDYDDYDDDVEEPQAAYGYEPDYYEPEYAPPRKVIKRKPKAQLASREAEPAPRPIKRKIVAAPSAKLMSCSKASGIVSGYGFSDVKSTDCQGQSYAFKAMRDGKPYVIKLSAKSGELTDVAKQ